MTTSLFTPIEFPPQPPLLTTDSRLLMLGSCFAQEVGQQLLPQLGPGAVTVNPLGPLYSPTTIAATLRAWLHDEVPAEPFLGHDGVWHSFQAASVCSAPTREECISRLQAAWHTGREALLQATHLIITFGTTRHYLHEGHPVANCHKEPASTFTEEEPQLPSLIGEWQDLLHQITALGSLQSCILTVSPYRYRKYGFHQSQLQKARLLLLCDALCQDAAVSYFPSYELLLDELRDYRFYAPDMLHPSAQAVEIIAQRFRQWSFSPALIPVADERLRQHRRSQHKPLI